MNHFAYPQMFWLLLLPFLFRAVLPAVKGLHGDALRVPFIGDLVKINLKSGGLWGRSTENPDRISLPLILLYLVWALLVAAAARPQWVGEPVRIKNYGRDILMVMDISNSMQEPDFALRGRRIDRLTAVKLVASDFIRKRTDDRIGLVLFGTRAYLQAPITYDKKSVEEILKTMDAGMAGDSTAIGDALGLALKTLKDSPNKDKKVIILLTDGENNDGALTLPQAINLAREEGVKVYTIGVGSDMSQSFFGFGMLGGRPGLDEASLRKIADETKGTYFRAKDTSSLVRIYDAIDKLEPGLNENQFVQETRELYYLPLLAALLLASVVAFQTRRAALWKSFSAIFIFCVRGICCCCFCRCCFTGSFFAVSETSLPGRLSATNGCLIFCLSGAVRRSAGRFHIWLLPVLSVRCWH